MSLLDALAYVLCVATVPALTALSPSLNRRAIARALTCVLIVGIGLEHQFAPRPWQSWLLLALATAGVVLFSGRTRVVVFAALAIGGPFLLRPGIAEAANQQFFGPYRLQILLVVSGFIFCVFGGSAFVEQILRLIKGLPSSSEDAESTSGAPAGGRIIGMLERAFAYCGVLLGHPEAAALVVAVKSVARFPEFSKPHVGRKFAEYFLIGTLLSIGFALATAFMIKAALSTTH